MPTQQATGFLDTVRKSQLVTESAIRELFPDGDDPNPKDAAAKLVAAGHLTTFQARALLAGRHRGLLLGPYRVLDELGRGGMGIVFLAEHTKLERRVAIKVLPREKTTDRLALERFYREARSVANLDHPNIVKAYDVCESYGAHYLVMEYVKGVNLQARVDKSGPLPWKAVAGYALQACAGLQHAHEKGLVHRDVKPSNLLVGEDGVLKILDLGLARCFTARDNVTAKYTDGTDVMGSADFISPEQAIAEHPVDIRSDLYSLGVTLFVLATGRTPFEGSTPQKLAAHQLKTPPRLDEVRPGVPVAFADIVARMLEKSPDDRYDTPADVIEQLQQVLGGTNETRPHTNPRMKRPTGGTGQFVVVTADEPDEEGDTRTDLKAGKTGKLTAKQKRIRKAKKEAAAAAARKQKILIAAAVLVPLLGIGGWLVARPKADKTETAQAAPEVPPPTPVVVTKAGGAPLTLTPAGGSTPSTPGVGGLVLNPAGSQPPARPQGAAEGPAVGAPAPEIEGEELGGECIRLSDYRGRVVLLDFWGFWCPHCRKMFPHERELVNQMQNRPFTLLGVNSDKDPAKLTQDLATNNIPWRSFKNQKSPTETIASAWGVRGWPTLYLIDHKGVVRQKWTGAPTDAELDQAVNDLVRLAEADAKPPKTP